jgi:hypothetical protein
MSETDLQALLSAPFEASEVEFRPTNVSGSRALALAYVDARLIQDRLDHVLGVDGWQDRYSLMPDGSCRLPTAGEARRRSGSRRPTSAARASSRTPATSSRPRSPTRSSAPP